MLYNYVHVYVVNMGFLVPGVYHIHGYNGSEVWFSVKEKKLERNEKSEKMLQYFTTFCAVWRMFII